MTMMTEIVHSYATEIQPILQPMMVKRFGQQTPRRWGWGTPLKKRTATRIKSSSTGKLKFGQDLSTCYRNLHEPGPETGMERIQDAGLDHSCVCQEAAKVGVSFWRGEGIGFR